MKSDTSFGIVHDSRLNLSQKREMLSSWASDVRSVPNSPALRRLDNGDVVNVHDILDALQALDEPGFPRVPRTGPDRAPPRRRSPSLGWARAMHRKRPTDDDDDPPPCPAVIAPLPGLSPSGAEAAPDHERITETNLHMLEPA